MSATLRLVHRTGYTYNGPAVASYNQARLAPRANADQTVLYTRLDVSPTPWVENWTDYWGTSVTSFEVHEPHEELKVAAISTVTVDRKRPVGKNLSWDELADQQVIDDWDELLQVDGRAAVTDDFQTEMRALRESCATPAEFVEKALDAINARVEYVYGRAGVSDAAGTAWRAGVGACQDIAHLTIAALRTVGIPARYVSGYALFEDSTPVGETIPAEMHAWVQWWDGTWIDIDPARRVLPDDFYIEVARGRDYDDVVPLRGIFTGTPGSRIFVVVEISRLA